MKRALISTLLAILLVTAALTGCANGTTSSSSAASSSTADASSTPASSSEAEEAASSDVAEGDSDEVFQSRTINFLSIWDDSDPVSDTYMILDLSSQYGETVEGFEIQHEYVGIDQLDQKVSILVSSNDLPEICTYESGSRLKDLIATGQILDVEAAWTELGIFDCLDDGAVSLLKNLVDDEGLYDVPLGLNVEGFWYNKALFEQAGITEVPETWDEFMDVCQKLVDAGIVPIVQGGSDSWPMTRVLNAYMVRSVGNDAVKDVIDGGASFNDPQYVAAAQMFADMAQKQYFSVGMTTIDPNTASSMLMNGQAAMKYDGSWFAGNLNSDENAAGPDGIGFFNVPTAGSDSTLDDYSMNCGNILVFSSGKYDEAVGDWMSYVFPKIGDYAINNNGAFKGYKINDMPELSTYSQIVADALGDAKGAFLWFEAKMDSESSALAQSNIAMLYSGEMTAEEYMAELQDSIERNRS
ncbi:MAG: ABC transporter substrate-binding protein [Oscillospiraceae bacterium]